MIICGVDPGKTTGYSLVEFLPNPKFYVIIDKRELTGTPRDVGHFIASQTAASSAYRTRGNSVLGSLLNMFLNTPGKSHASGPSTSIDVG